MADSEYHEMREQQERERADAAADEAIRKIHNDLADRHAAKASAERMRAPSFVKQGLSQPLH